MYNCRKEAATSQLSLKLNGSILWAIGPEHNPCFDVQQASCSHFLRIATAPLLESTFGPGPKVARSLRLAVPGTLVAAQSSPCTTAGYRETCVSASNALGCDSYLSSRVKI